MAVVIAAGVVVVAGIDGLGRRAVLRRIERLDEERHGLREAYDRARLDSLRDGLTGLGNHRAFQEELTEQVAVAREEQRPFALLYVDIDDLKKLNDSRGHAAGDALLSATSRILSSNMRRWDRGFRIGGDEFAVVLDRLRPRRGGRDRAADPLERARAAARSPTGRSRSR